MKRVGLIFVLLLLALQGWAQSPLYYFSYLDDFFGKGFADEGFEIQSFSDTSYVIGGISVDSVPGAIDGYVYARPTFIVVNEQGDILTKRNYSRPYEQLGTIDNDIFLKTSDGGYAIAGLWQRWTPGFAGTYYGRYLLKLDSLLDSTWIALDSGSMVLGRGLNVRKMVQCSDNGYMICGNDHANRTVFTKFSESGNLLWNKVLPYYSTYFWTMQLVTNGNIFLAGQMGYNSYLLECDFDGNVVWDSTFNNVGSSFQNGSSALRLTNGELFVYDFVPDDFGAYDMHCMWWTASNDLRCERLIEMEFNQFSKSILELSDGSVVLAGQTGAAGSPDIDKRAFLLKMSSNGDLLWLRHYYYWYNGGSPLADCALAHDGGFIMTGASWDTTGVSPYTDTWILKVDSVGCPYPNCGPSLAVQPTETVQPNLIQAFPNPASTRLNLKCKESGLHEKSVLRLLALDGKVMDEVIMPMGFQEIGFDVSRFPAGVYFWEYRDEIGRRETGRFEVMR